MRVGFGFHDNQFKSMNEKATELIVHSHSLSQHSKHGPMLVLLC